MAPLLSWLLIVHAAAAADAGDQGPIVLRNRCCAIAFAPRTGELAGIENVLLADRILKGKASFGTPFRLHADSSREWLLDSNPETAAKVHLGPEGLALKSVERKAIVDGESLELTYDGNGFECRLTVVLAADCGDSTWTLSVKNAAAAPHDVLVEFPRVSGVQLGQAGARNMQTVLNQAGWIGEAWQGGGGIYGNSGQWSMQWHAVFDPVSRSALGLIVMDSEIRNKQLVLSRPDIAVRYFPPRRLAAGETITLPAARLLIYTGDWRRTARQYAAWYGKALPHATAPPWFLASDSIDGRHLKKRTKPDDRPDYDIQFVLNSFRELPAAVIQKPFDNTEYAFWSRGSMLFGKHTDGDNRVREDLGGAEAMREGFAGVRGLGLHSTLYIEGYIVAKESELAKAGKAERWSVMNRDGSINGPYTGQGFFHMCPGCVEWQDHLAAVATRALKECGADGLRLDSLGFYFLPCYNPAHHHATPFGYNEWMKQLLAKVHDAAVAANPNALLTTEAPVDFYGQWFHGALTQCYAADVPPMRLAVSPYRPAVYSPAGAVWGSLSGFAGGSENWDPQPQGGGAHWLCARAAAHEALVGGDVADESPRFSDSEIVARRFIGDCCEAVVAARVPRHEGRWRDGVRLSERRKEYEIRLPAGAMPPKRIAVCDIETLDWKGCQPERRGGELVIRTRSNWLLVVIPRGAERVVSFDPLPPAHPGGQITVRPLPLTGDSSGDVEIWAPGLRVGAAGQCQARVPMGEAVAIGVPNDAFPGWYQIRVGGNHVLGVKRLLRVAAKDGR